MELTHGDDPAGGQDRGPQDRQSTTLNVTTSHEEGGTYVLTLVGEVDLSSVESLQASVDAVMAASPNAVCFELSGVRFMDSSGLAILLTVTGAVSDVRVLDPSSAVRRLIALSGLESILRITP